MQHALGHDALPLACRQFPRVTVLDPRGASVTLSHYCPTAAGLLKDDGPVAIEINGATFPPGGEYVGLDAQDALPPLLCRDVLMDWESWWASKPLQWDCWPTGADRPPSRWPDLRASSPISRRGVQTASR